jgi:hypothetical protein
MTFDFELACGGQVGLPVGMLRRISGGRVELEQDGLASSVVVEDLADSDPLVGMSFADWLCAVGSAGSSILSGTSTPLTLRIDGHLDRLNLQGRYDPGGLYRVRLFAVGDDACLIETEIGLCQVRRGRGVCWTVVHDDLTATVLEVRGGEVVVSSESSLTRFSLSDGELLGSEPHDLS